MMMYTVLANKAGERKIPKPKDFVFQVFSEALA